MNRTRGFSLTELMIVIAIMSIVATIASYSWQRYVRNTGLRTAARNLVTDMANTKQRAVRDGVRYQMTITAGTPGNYTIEQRNADDTAFTIIATKNPDDLGTGTASGAGLKINNTLIITFRPRGTATMGTVVLENNRGSTATITSNITGKIHVTFAMQ